MRATGIVRRIDDLGRVVIPKEIRRNLHITEGQPLEIFISEGGGVVFMPYRKTLIQRVKDLADTVAIEACDNREGEKFKRLLRALAEEMEKSEAFPY